jgi:hypothetical protein
MNLVPFYYCFSTKDFAGSHFKSGEGASNFNLVL